MKNGGGGANRLWLLLFDGRVARFTVGLVDAGIGGGPLVLEVDVDGVLRNTLEVGTFIKFASRLLTLIRPVGVIVRSSSRSRVEGTGTWTGAGAGMIGASNVGWVGSGDEGGDCKCLGFTGIGGTLLLDAGAD